MQSDKTWIIFFLLQVHEEKKNGPGIISTLQVSYIGKGTKIKENPKKHQRKSGKESNLFKMF